MPHVSGDRHTVNHIAPQRVSQLTIPPKIFVGFVNSRLAWRQWIMVLLGLQDKLSSI
jgi:hypothetical protein